MTTKHDSFDASSHGFFVESPHSFRNGIEGRILLWDYYEIVLGRRWFMHEAFRVSLPDATIDTYESFDGTLRNYSLVVLAFSGLLGAANTLPSWWSQVATFAGRLCLTTIGTTAGVSGRQAITQASAITGLTAIRGINSVGRFVDVASDPLTAGVSVLLESAGGVAECAGGSSLLVAGQWLRHNSARYLLCGNYGWAEVASGRTSFSFTPAQQASCRRFAANLFNVSV